MPATTLRYCVCCSSACCGLVGVAVGFSTHRITKNPIMSMTRSANVKIHSGHSSHSAALHRHAAFLAMGYFLDSNPNHQVPNRNEKADDEAQTNDVPFGIGSRAFAGFLHLGFGHSY